MFIENLDLALRFNAIKLLSFGIQRLHCTPVSKAFQCSVFVTYDNELLIKLSWNVNNDDV